jgi:hypothetical protein
MSNSPHYSIELKVISTIVQLGPIQFFTKESNVFSFLTQYSTYTSDRTSVFNLNTFSKSGTWRIGAMVNAFLSAVKLEST